MKKTKEHKKSCSPKCWFAKRDKCECICEGKNHQRGLAMDRGSQKLVEEMKREYEKYKKARREERKLLRAGLSPQASKYRSVKSSSFMKTILRLGKQVKK